LFRLAPSSSAPPSAEGAVAGISLDPGAAAVFFRLTPLGTNAAASFLKFLNWGSADITADAATAAGTGGVEPV
jgi:hypothetical protein